METIKSFEVDHTKLLPGIYVSRKDTYGGMTITTLDLRWCFPNLETLTPASVHTIEHLGAVFFRNHTDLPVLYFGPMGCLTGFYLILGGNWHPRAIYPTVLEWLDWIDTVTEVPGCTKKECGNCALHSLTEAKEEAKIWKMRISSNLQTEYPR